MHCGKINRGLDNAASRVYNHLRQYRGQWWDAKNLSDCSNTICLSTQISGIKPQLPEGETIEYKREYKGGLWYNYYRLVRRMK